MKTRKQLTPDDVADIRLKWMRTTLPEDDRIEHLAKILNVSQDAVRLHTYDLRHGITTQKLL